MLTFNQFNNLNEAKTEPKGSGHTHYTGGEFNDLTKNFKKDYLVGKYKDLNLAYDTYPLYVSLSSKKTLPQPHKRFKTQKPLFYYGLISASFFRSSSAKHFNVWVVTEIINDEAAKIQDMTPLSNYNNYLYIKGKGIYYIKGNGDNSHIPSEYQQYV